ncbi:NAD-dependent epimerase/dehydratase family protein [Streptomyces sp. NBC_01198]|uniref:NAD-dependent epimerase/dehydratase family protein n=1 Tax=Streptomyces sp. NBC_01198 TaxID=2903769 RepID=UPI002E133D26|nr:NAD-dependent epimerase/dehydratase family protein [Streptomyces sp. NBC_01198]
MKLLVLGGSWFLGREVVEEAKQRGWEVTTFNRGRSAPDPEGVTAVHGDRSDPASLAYLAELGPWDAVVDTSASEMPPKVVLEGTRALAGATGRYVYVSTVSVYQGWPDEALTETSPVLPCPADAGPEYGAMPPGADGPNTHYGTQKAGAENAVLEVFKDRSVVLRPGVILGPGEYVGRLPWWLRRTETGGRILAPGDPARSIQPVDVRDVAAFAVDQAQAPTGGVYNVTAPVGRETMGGFLRSCLEVTGSTGELVWAPDAFLVDQGVRQWTELPLWRTHAGVWRIDSAGAYAAGLTCRPLEQTVEDTWAWLQADGRPVDHPRWAEHGMDPEQEARILAALGSGLS